MKSKQSIRLSKEVIPKQYTISIKPDLEAFRFEGDEQIELTLKKSVKKITLHSKDLEILTAEFTHRNKSSWAAKISYNQKLETATFLFPKLLPKGGGTLRLVFRGLLGESLQGYYRSKYMHGDTEKFLATTQFEPTDARRAFPCFDEPAHKAVFTVSMIVPEHHTAISNTLPQTIAEHESGYKVVTFEPTPKMSTYLLAFISGEFEHLEGKTRRGVKIRVFTTPGKKHMGQFALECAIKFLDFYEKYFDIKYPMPVLDMIAIPDFAAGAMENWGAITYRESQFLVDPVNSSALTKQWSAITVAHELVHQWFGNLVTMEWWTHLWLNESFAAYIEYLAVDHIFPEWDMWTQFAYLDAGSALTLDSLANTHPIEVEVHHPDEISEIFDAISYQKGSSLLRMLAEYVGEKAFRDGLRLYLKKHSYKNAKSDDLWKAIEIASKKPVRKIMHKWLLQPGYPLVSIKEDRELVKLTQSRFFISPHSRKKIRDNATWPIPFTYATLDGKKQKQILFEKKSTEFTKPKFSKALKFNIGETGFYRVDYPASYIPELKRVIESKKLPPRDRLGILTNVFAMAESGQSLTTEALELIEGFKNETDYTVWLELMSSVRAVARLLDQEPFFPAYQKFSEKFFEKIANHVGWAIKKNEKHTDSMLRGTVLYQYADYGNIETIERAQKYFWEYVSGKRKISPDFRGFIFQIAAKYGGRKEYDVIMDLYKQEQLTEEKNRLGRALASFPNKQLLKKTLAFALSRHVRPQDTINIVAAAWVNPIGRTLSWEFTKKHWGTLLKRYGSGGHMLVKFVQLTELLSSEADARDVEKFFKAHPAPGAGRAVQQALEKIHANASWLTRERTNIYEWLLTRNHNGTTN